MNLSLSKKFKLLMQSSAALLTLSGVLLCPSAQAKTLEVGSRAEKFSLKVVNSDSVGKPTFSLNKFIGPSAETAKKVVVLSFFATYCEPCKRELPLLQELYARYADQGLGIMVVSIDKDKDVPGGAAKAIGDLASEHKLTFPVLHDRFNIVAKRYGIEKLPCLYMIDQDGQVAFVNVGYSDDFSNKLVSEVQRRLGVKVEALPGHGGKKGKKRQHKAKAKAKAETKEKSTPAPKNTTQK